MSRSSRPIGGIETGARELLEPRVSCLPPPLAVQADWVLRAAEDGDRTGVVRWLFSLGVAVVTYGAATGLSALAERNLEVSDDLGLVLRKAARWSDGHWAALGRLVCAALPAAQRSPFEFLRATAIERLVQERNAFVHGLADGFESLRWVAAVLEQASTLLESLPFVAGATVILQGGELHGLRCDPWLPVVEGVLHLPAEPRGVGRPWRYANWTDRTRHDCPALTSAIGGLVGVDPDLPKNPTSLPALCGRPRLLEDLRTTLVEARLRPFSAIALRADQPGAGRTRLLRELSGAGGTAGIERVCFGTCVPNGGPFQGLRDAAESDPVLRVQFGRILAGDPLAGPNALDDTLRALERAVRERATDGLMLVLDDVHHADEGVLSLVLRLLQMQPSSGERLLLVLSSRASVNVGSTKAISSLDRALVDAGVVWTRLAPLTLDDMGSLIQAVAPLDPVLAEAVAASADGNPGRAMISVLHWFESGKLEWNEGRWGARADSLGERTADADLEQLLLSARLTPFVDLDSPLGRVVLNTLAAIALANRRVTQRVFDDVLGRLAGEPALAAGARAVLVESQVAELEPEVAISSAPLRRAALAGRGTSLGKEALLDVLANLPDAAQDADLLRNGYRDLGNSERAAYWTAVHVDHLMRLGSFESAARVARELREVASTPRSRAQAGLLLARALVRGARYAEALDATRAALRFRKLSHEQIDLRIVRLTASFGSGAYRPEEDPNLIADSDELGDTRLRVMTRCAFAHCLRTRSALSFLDEAEELVLDVPDSVAGDLSYRVDVTRLEILFELGAPLDEMRDAAARARDSAHAAGSKWATLDVQSDEAVFVAAAGKPDQAADLFERLARQADADQVLSVFLNASVNRAACLLQAKKLEHCIAAAEAAADRCASIGAWREMGAAHSIRAEALTGLNRLDEALEAVNSAISSKERGRDPRLALPILRRAELMRRSNRLEDALSEAARAEELARGQGNRAEELNARLFRAVFALQPDPGRIRSCLDEIDASAVRLVGSAVELLSEAQRRLGSS